MMSASKSTSNSLKILRHKVTKNLANLPLKFCEFCNCTFKFYHNKLDKNCKFDWKWIQSTFQMKSLMFSYSCMAFPTNQKLQHCCELMNQKSRKNSSYFLYVFSIFFIKVYPLFKFQVPYIDHLINNHLYCA